MDTEAERLHAASFYEAAKISPRKARTIIDAFLDKGFVLRDVGGGDIVWTLELYASTNSKDPALSIEIAGGMGRLLSGLDRAVQIQVRGRGEAGIYFSGMTARDFLSSMGTFNLWPRE